MEALPGIIFITAAVGYLVAMGSLVVEVFRKRNSRISNLHKGI
jgi:hypothetical protein